MEKISRAEAHRLIIGPHLLSNAMTFELVEAAREVGTRVSLLPDMLEVVGSSIDFDELFGVTLLGVRHTQLSRSSQAPQARLRPDRRDARADSRRRP